MTHTAIKFNSLTLEKQSNLINCYGHWIWFTDYQHYRISVFEINGEIVEVWYDLRERAIWRIRIPDYEELDIHLKRIKLNIP